MLENSPQLDEVLQQSGRFAAIRKQIRIGTLSHEGATRTLSQLRAALLDLLREMENPTDTPALKEALEAAFQIANSKNVVANSKIQAGGDVHIGDMHITQHAEKVYNIEKIDRADFS